MLDCWWGRAWQEGRREVKRRRREGRQAGEVMRVGAEEEKKKDKKSREWWKTAHEYIIGRGVYFTFTLLKYLQPPHHRHTGEGNSSWDLNTSTLENISSGVSCPEYYVICVLPSLNIAMGNQWTPSNIFGKRLCVRKGVSHGCVHCLSVERGLLTCILFLVLGDVEFVVVLILLSWTVMMTTNQWDVAFSVLYFWWCSGQREDWHEFDTIFSLRTGTTDTTTIMIMTTTTKNNADKNDK